MYREICLEKITVLFVHLHDQKLHIKSGFIFHVVNLKAKLLEQEYINLFFTKHSVVIQKFCFIVCFIGNKNSREKFVK